MAIEKTETDCGCTITVYGDGSASPEIGYCDLHDAAKDLRGCLAALRRDVIESERWHPDCLRLLATNQALAMVDGRVYDASQIRGEIQAYEDLAKKDQRVRTAEEHED